jgi:thioredoxin-related protein
MIPVSQRILTLFLMTLAAISMHGQAWETDFTKAKTRAAKENKPIILVFQGSDWCAPCIRLNREVWSSQEFITYAKKNYILLQADFPRKKQNALPPTLAKANAQLAEAYNKNGIFPFVVVLDASGKILGQTSYKKMSPKEYIALLESFKV